MRYLFEDESQATKAAKIIRALLEAQSPRLSNIAEKMKGKNDTCYKPLVLDWEFSYLELLECLVIEMIQFVIRVKLGDKRKQTHMAFSSFLDR